MIDQSLLYFGSGTIWIPVRCKCRYITAGGFT